MRGICGIALTLALLMPAPPGIAQQDPIRRETVHFRSGASGTSLTGHLKGREAVLYRIGAEAGQTIDVHLKSPNTALYFNLYAPGRGMGDDALANGSMTDPLNRYTGPLPQSGDYTVAVFLYRNAARDGESADYTLDISITGATSAVVQGDFADALQGGPDFWAVTNLTTGDTLNLRAEPSAQAPIRLKLAQGAILRNTGCRNVTGTRWCHVQLTGAGDETGWVAGRYLRESAGP